MAWKRWKALRSSSSPRNERIVLPRKVCANIFWRVPQQEEWAAGERGRHVAQLHPALRPPPEELHFVRREMFGPDDRRGAVVFFEPLVDDQPAVSQILGHWRTRIRRGVLDVRPVH